MIKTDNKMITRAAKYDYPVNGNYSETHATLDDGRVVTICTQYSRVLPHGVHADNCDQINVMGGRCTCGLLDGVDIPALVADARANGKRGKAPKTPAEISADEATEKKNSEDIEKMEARRKRNGYCSKCGSYCHGDCQS